MRASEICTLLVVLGTSLCVLAEDYELEKNLLDLNIWLTRNVGGDEDPEKNYQAAVGDERNRDKFRLATDLFIQLATAQECDASLLDSLLVVAHIKRKFGSVRVVKTLSPHVERVMRSCAPILDKQVELINAEQVDSESAVGRLVNMFKNEAQSTYEAMPWKLEFWITGHQYNRPFNLELIKQIGSDIFALAQGDPRAVLVEQQLDEFDEQIDKFYPDRFEAIYKQYILEPCEQYVRLVAKVYDNLNLSSYLAKSIREYVEREIAPLTEEFKRSGFVYRKCRTIMLLTEEDVQLVYRAAVSTYKSRPSH